MISPFSKKRRQALGLRASAAALGAAGAARAARPLRLIVAYPAGGVADNVARLLADRLGSVLDRSIVVENRAGAGGTIGMDVLAQSKPDGATLGFAAISPLTLNPYLAKVGYKPMDDIVPVASVMYSPVYLLATEAFKGKTFADAVAQAKSQPQGLTIACSGYGSVGYIMIEQLRRQTGANFIPVPYQGDSQIVTGAAGAQFDLLTINPTEAVSALLQSGKLRLVAVSAPRRLPTLPDMPTLAELGYQDANRVSLFGFFAPAAIPAEFVQRFNTEVNKLLQQPDVRDRLRKLDNIPFPGTPEQFAATIRAEYLANGKLIKEANIKVG